MAGNEKHNIRLQPQSFSAIVKNREDCGFECYESVNERKVWGYSGWREESVLDIRILKK